MTTITWAWIPLTLWAAFAQTLRNAAQRHLTRELGTLGATSIRFVYGLPFAIVWLALLVQWFESPFPTTAAQFWVWVSVASLAQIAGTGLLLRVMSDRNFALGVAYSKTEAIQVAIIAILFLNDSLSSAAVTAVIVATLGVLLISATDHAHPLRALAQGWTTRSAHLGLGAGAAFALSAVGFRNATVALAPTHFAVSAAFTAVIAQGLQSLGLLLWLRFREPGTITRVARAWRGSLLAGFMGTAATVGWFTAMAIESVAHVRTLGLSELFFSLLISRRVFREHLRPIEWIGMGLLAMGLALIAWFR